MIKHEQFPLTPSAFRKDDLRHSLSFVSCKGGEERQDKGRIGSRYLDKLVDELSKGRKMEKILRGT